MNESFDESHEFKTGSRVPVFKNWVAMYGGRSAAKYKMVPGLGDVTLEFVKNEYDGENNMGVKVYRMSKNGSVIGQGKEYENGKWLYFPTLVGSRPTASKYTVKEGSS